MPDSILVALPEPTTTSATTLRLPLIIAIISCASLLLELALTRLFSVVLFYHFAFLAISVALLGLGAGGVFAHLFRAKLARWTISVCLNLCFTLGPKKYSSSIESTMQSPMMPQRRSGQLRSNTYER